MKQRISDLLDGFQEVSIDLREPTPLSPERIKELTMGKLEYRQEKKQSKGKRIAFRILVAAAVIALLPVTVLAAEQIFGAGDWFKGRMNDQLKEDRQYVEENRLNIAVQETVSQGQVDVANELGQNFREQTVTSNGTTMTMTAAYGDEYVLHVYLQVEAPEGTVLPDGVLYKFYDPDEIRPEGDHPWQPLVPGEGAPYDDIYAQMMKVTPLPDGDPGDNKKDFDILLTRQYLPEEAGSGRQARFNDGFSKLLSFTGIYEQVVDMDGDEDGYVPFATGAFTFDIGLVNEAEVLDLDVSKAAYGGHKVRQWTHPGAPHRDDCYPYDENGVHTQEYDFIVTPDFLKISPLTAQWKNHYTCSDKMMGCGLNFRIVMKDGTTPVYQSAGGSAGDDWQSCLLIFTTPIDLSQIDYIEIGDPDVGEPYRIDMN